MGYNFTCCFLQRVLLPVILGICMLVRPVGTSLIYLLMFFILPFIPIVISSKLKASLKAYFIILIMLTATIVVAHCVLVIYPLVVGEKEVIKGCDDIELSIRHIGFLVDQLNVADTLLWIWPDVLLLSSSILIFIGLKKFSSQPQGSEESIISAGVDVKDEEDNQLKILRNLGPVSCLASLFLAAVFRPSAPGGLYFIVFLLSATHWACYKSFARGFAILLRCVMIVLALHIIALLSYQTPWSQENLKNDTLPARLVALESVILSTCDLSTGITKTPYYFNDSLYSDSFLAPAMILICYYVLALTSNLLINRRVSIIKQPAISCNKTKRTRSYNVTSSCDTEGLSQPTERSPFIRRTSDKITKETDDIELKNFGEIEEQPTTTIFDHIWYGVVSTWEFMYRNSYVFTNILMMVWSIVYHSWLTFVLLIWANILWLFPNQRKTMLRSSPFVVFYAELLLIAQYIYGMRLNDEELPTKVEIKGINLQQIGLSRVEYMPCVPLFVKTAFTLMFWFTLRQRCKEKAEQKKTSTLAHMAAPLQLTVGAATTDLASKPDTKKKSEFFENLGNFIKKLLIKIWIWLLLGVVFMCAITGTMMTGFRICYMALFLFFIVSFQCSWKAWLKIMYGFWIFLIFYAMSILILIYTYQFDRFDEYWEVHLNISEPLQRDIGLKRYKTKDLFLHLVTPTVIVIMAIIQIHYFHKQFVEHFKMDTISVVRSISPDVDVEALNAAGPSDEMQPEKNEQPSNDENEPQGKLKSAEIFWRTKLKKLFKSVLDFLKSFKEFFWSLLEIHMIRVVILTTVVCSLFEISMLHALLVFLCVIALMSRTWVQIYISRLMSFFLSVLIIANMVYQIDYINHETYNVTCGAQSSANSARWFGLYKISSSRSLLYLLRGYLVYMVVATLHAVVIFRQEQKRAREGLPVEPPAVIFPKTTKIDANQNLTGLVKYLFNYGFFRFGFELTMIALVSTIAYRRDLIAIVYAFWLCILMSLEREKSEKIWTLFKWFLALLIPVQYILYVGLPPALCVVYPWEELLYSEKTYVLSILPSPTIHSEASKLIFDFVLFLFTCRQSRSYIVENKFEKMKSEFPGGSNKAIITDIEKLGMVSFENPIHDFKSYTRNWLDVVNVALFTIFFWVTLAICFLAATNVLSIFSVGYLVGAFVFLWQGTDFYLRPIRQILLWWRWFLGYNIAVIAVRACLQIFLCFFLQNLEVKHCWLIQLFGVSCTENIKPNQNSADEVCPKRVDGYGLAWDATCFVFLVFQLRIFGSYYFCHIINDAKAISVLASRGAVLIEDFRQKQIQHRTKHEMEVLRKIKEKMEQIRATQQKMLEGAAKQTHFAATRAGDYYMFDEPDEKIELSLMDEGGDLLEDEGKISASEKKISKRKGFMQVYHEIEKRKQAKRVQEAASAPTSEIGLPQDKTKEQRDTQSDPLPKSSLYDLEKEKPSGSSDVADSGDASKTENVEDKQGVAGSMLEGIMVSLAIRLHRLSRNFRYVMKILSDEKRQLKDTMKYGKQVGLTKKNWEDRESVEEPANTLPETNLYKDNLENQSSSSSDNIDTDTKTITIYDDIKDNTNRNLLGTSVALSKPRRKSSDVPQIRVLAPSLERGLDESATLFHNESEISRPDSPDSFEEDTFTTREHHLAIEVIISLWFVILSNTDAICYLFVFIHQIVSASLLSLPLPLMVLMWGTLAIPRPSKSFWVTVIAYVQAIVLIKCLFQFKSFWFQSINLPNQPMTADKIIGIQAEHNYAVYDLLLLLVLFFHRFILKSQGLWDSLEVEQIVQSGAYILQDDLPDDDDIGTVDESRQTAVATKGQETLVVSKSRTGDETEENDIDLQVLSSPEEHGSYVPEVIKLSSAKYLSPIKDFFKNIVNKARLPTDVYALMFLCDFINFLVLLFGCTAFGPQNARGDGVQDFLVENKVPIPFLIMLMLQFFLIAIDRAIYLRKALKSKIVFHLLSVIGIHVWMFFVLPAFTERSFNALAPPVVFYLFKCLYFLLSSYQIKCGYPKRVLGNFLTRGYTYLNQMAFSGYKIVPFLYELRTLLDWVFTETTMSLWEWLKMEDIFSEIYNIKCSREYEKGFPIPRAQKKNLFAKLGLGVPFISAFFIIIWGPLLLFAVFNSVGEPNTPLNIEFTIKIGPYSPIYKMSAMDVFQTFDESAMAALQSHYMKNKTALTFITGYNPADIAVISLPAHSTNVWGISPPEKESLLADLLQNRDLTMRFTYAITRRAANEEGLKEEVVSLTTTFNVNENFEGRNDLISMLQGQSGDSVILVPGVFPKFLEIKNSGKLNALEMLLPNQEEYIPLLLKLSMSGTGENSNLWWTVTENCNDSLHVQLLSDLSSSECESKMVIYTFNDKKFPTTFKWISAGGIIGMYTGIVLVSARLIRTCTFNTARSIMFTHLPYVDRILQLCLDVYLVREAKEFALEEDLFAKLIFLYRSPETMIKWTRPKADALENGAHEDEARHAPE